jgi:alpha-L-arabinofuranosidase
MERNSDLIVMSCYAPLLVNVNPGARQWGTNLIGYDALVSYPSPAYYVQQMFYQNRGDTVLPVTLKPQEVPPPPPPPLPHGMVGVGTWSTQSEYKDLKVTKDGQVVYMSDLTKGLGSWKANNGDWKVVDGALRQNSNETNSHIITGDPKWSDYTLEVKARKLGGAEGFMVLFDVLDEDNWIWWNVGGWTNTRTALERSENGAKSEFGKPVDMKIENNRWYDLMVETKGRSIKCYLDGKLISDATVEPPPPAGGVFSTASRDRNGDVIVKVVNAYPTPQRLQVNVQGVKQVNGTATVLKGDPKAVNSIEHPDNVAPKAARPWHSPASFPYDFPGNSVTVMRLQGR